MSSSKIASFCFLISACLCCLYASARAEFSLTPDRNAFSFGFLEVGRESGAQYLSLLVHSDDPAGWTLKFSGQPLTHTNGVATFPAGAYRYWFTGALPGPGVQVPLFTQDAPVPNVTTVIYTCQSPDCIDSSTFGLGFRVIVPGAQQKGSYSSALSLTLESGY